MYMSAPVFADGAVYGMSNKRKGQFVRARRRDRRGALGDRGT